MFVPHSEIDLKKMFEELSISSLDDLFTHIPETLKLNDGLNVPGTLSELESIAHFESVEAKNTQNLICFAGGGHYDVYLPHTVKTLTMRPEFMTGEDGVEVMLDTKDTVNFLNMLETKGVKPCGLGSRDTLRLEASLPLYGFELTDDISPVEAGLKWTITNENEYLGKQIIDEQISSKQHKHLRRFKLNAKQIARTGTTCISDGVEGVVTSGNISPILGYPIGYVLFKSNPADNLVEFEIRGNLVEGNLIYKRFLS